MEKASIGFYCYDMALSKIHSSKNNALSSPNNVRRIIISGDGVIVETFTSTGGSFFKECVFNPVKAFDCFCAKDFTPIIKCLVDLVCSNVEEIIFCLDSESKVALSQQELNLSALLKGYTGSISPDLAKSLLGRFVRLRSIVFFSGKISVLSAMKDKLHGYSYSVAEDESLSSFVTAKSTDNKTWYMNKRLRPQHYSMDVSDGNLSRHFDKVSAKLMSSDKESRVSNLNNERLKSKRDIAHKLSSKISSYYKCINRLYTILSTCSNEGILSEDRLSTLESFRVKILCTTSDVKIPDLDLKDILSGDMCRLLLKESFTTVVIDLKDEQEKYELLLQSLRLLVEDLYLCLFDCFVSAVALDLVSFPTITQIKFSDFHPHSIFKPQGANLYSFHVEEFFKESFSKNEGTTDISLINMCMWYTKLFVPKSACKNKDAYTREYWRALLVRKEDK